MERECQNTPSRNIQFLRNWQILLQLILDIEYMIIWYYMILYDYIWLYMYMYMIIAADTSTMYLYEVSYQRGREGGDANGYSLWLQHMYHHSYWPAGVSTKPTVGVWMVFITQHTHSTLCLLCKTGFLCMQNISWSERSARKTTGVCGVANTNRFEVWLFRLSRISYHISHIYRKEAIRILIWDSWGYSEQLDL